MFVLGSSLARLGVPGQAGQPTRSSKEVSGALGRDPRSIGREADGRPVGVSARLVVLLLRFVWLFCIVDVVFCPFQIYVTCFI